MFEEIRHTADYAIRARGADLPELFVAAARGMNHLTGGRAGRPARRRTLTLEGRDLESLLVAWLGELAFWMEVEGEFYDQFEIHHLTPTALQVTVVGGPAVGIEKLIKAVTYHDLAIRPTPEGYEATVVFDV